MSFDGIGPIVLLCLSAAYLTSLATTPNLWHNQSVREIIDKVLLSLCFALLVADILSNPMSLNATQRVLLGLGLFFLLLFFAYTLNRYKEKEAEKAPLPPSRPIALRAKYNISALPISVPRKTTVYVLQLHPGITQWLFSTTNGEAERDAWWPSSIEELRKKGVTLPDTIQRCDVTNHGEIALSNIILNFGIKFYKGLSMSKDTVPVFSYNRPVVIDVLQPNQTFSFYIVNQSPFLVLVEYPKEGIFHVIGESNQRSISLVQPQPGATILDILPSWSFAPTSVPWTGLPNMPKLNTSSNTPAK